jgi:hypothetical protein
MLGSLPPEGQWWFRDHETGFYSRAVQPEFLSGSFRLLAAEVIRAGVAAVRDRGAHRPDYLGRLRTAARALERTGPAGVAFDRERFSRWMERRAAAHPGERVWSVLERGLEPTMLGLVVHFLVTDIDTPADDPQCAHIRPFLARTCDATRDVFPRGAAWPAPLSRNWLTSDVCALAKRAWWGNRFDLLPILADALQDAGCDREDVLDHLRGPGPHCRGCWVLNRILCPDV